MYKLLASFPYLPCPHTSIEVLYSTKVSIIIITPFFSTGGLGNRGGGDGLLGGGGGLLDLTEGGGGGLGSGSGRVGGGGEGGCCGAWFPSGFGIAEPL